VAVRKFRRLVFLFGGFETNAAEEQRSRFVYAAEKTGPLWDAAFEVGALQAGSDGQSEFHVEASGAGWAAQTDVVVCDWSDLIVAVQSQNPVRRFICGLWALLSFMLNGTLFRYLRTSWRYGLFFLYPVLLSAAALMPLALIAWGGIWAPAAILLCAGLLWLFSKEFHLMVLLDNWSFARAAALERNAAILNRTASFQTAMQTRIRAMGDGGGNPEVLIAAHSLGACFAAMALSGALAQIKPGQPIPGLLMAGSSLLKIALHPKAVRLRAAVGTIAKSDVHWLEVQSLTDLLNFYGADPVAALNLTPKRPPVLQFVRFRTMLTPQTYRRIKFNWLRVHRQFVLASERRTNYSFHMMLAGPFCLAEIMENRGLPQAFVETAEIKGPNS
jgi:hypothetical protein